MPPDERERFIVESCADDIELRDGMLRLLEAHRHAGGFLDELPQEGYSNLAAQLKEEAPAEEQPGDRFGRYQLLELIGQGSWGAVWLAKQTEDIERRVALKILKVGLDADEFLQRFEAERQVLAIMDHPNIAHVLDAGTTVYGRPYLVMELINSTPLLEYADRENLSLENRIRLFEGICHGAHHAHQKGVIHRDLKPSNVLVAVYDNVPVSKIIDFGVAKTALPGNSGRDIREGTRGFFGTPVYSSPEQLDENRFDVDNRSDIYSLGALLYELLCGCPPFDPEPLFGLELDEIRRIVSRTVPVPPSDRYDSLAKFKRDLIAEARGSESKQIRKKLVGDLDFIVMKCLSKKPSHRYATASDLAIDLDTSLKNEPVASTPKGAIYRLMKYFKRNRPIYALWVEMPAILLVACSAFFFAKSASVLEPKEGLSRDPANLVLANYAIAVLPFNNLSQHNEYNSFPTNVQNDIAFILSELEAPLVMSRVETLRYRDTNKSNMQIGSELGVRYLVDGGVERNGSEIRINLKLIDSQTNTTVWSKSFNGDFDELYDFEIEAIQGIAAKLNTVIPSDALAEMGNLGTSDPSAYEAYMEARNVSGLEKIKWLENAVSIDPDFTEAWVGLAWGYIVQWRIQTNRTDADLKKRADKALVNLKRLDPGRALEMKAAFVFNEFADIEAAIGYHLEAMSLGLGGGGRDLAWFYMQIGRMTEARHYLEDSFKDDPNSSEAMAMLHSALVYDRQWDEARGTTRDYLGREGDTASNRYRLMEELAQIDYLQNGSRESFELEVNQLAGFSESDRGRLWSALISRDLNKAKTYIEEWVAKDPISLVFASNRFSWSLSFENPILLVALVKLELGDDVAARESARLAQEQIKALIESSSIVDPDHHASLAICEALLGDRGMMEQWIEITRESTRSVNWHYRRQVQCEMKFAIACLVLGDEDAALQILESASFMRSPIFVTRELDLWFVFDRLKGRPRYDRFIAE